MTLKGDPLRAWITFRRETVRRRLQYRLDKVLATPASSSKACSSPILNIDEVIEHHPQRG
jgi:topoisomerase-4 subunit A